MAKRPYTLLEYLVTIEMELKKLKKIVAESVGADYSELIANIDGIRNELNTFKTSITGTVDTNNTNLITKFNSLEQQFNTFKTSITNTVNSNNTTLTSQLSTLNTQFSQFKTTIESQFSSLNTRVTSVERRVTTLENSGGSSGGTVDLTEVNNRISTNENNILTLQSDVSSLKGRVTTLENNQGSTGGSSGGSSGGSVEADVYGEKLLAHYIHKGNPEFQFTSFNFTTCEGTTSKAHGLTEATEVMVVPNGWTLNDRKYGIGSIPTEWVHYDGIIKLVPVDDITLRVTKNDGTTLLPVDIGSDVNQNVDYNKFHFEQTKSWTISNLPKSTNYFRIIIKGYVKPNTYRYLMWKSKDSEGKEVSESYPPLYAIIPPSVNTPKPFNAAFGIHDIIFDFRDNLLQYDTKCYIEGRRSKLANVVWDMAEEKKVYYYDLKGNNVTLSSIGNFSEWYAFNSNGTHVYIYDMGGTL